MRQGLTKSKNLVSVRILQTVGTQKTQDWAVRFGFPAERTPPYLTMALGAGSVTPWQMMRGYAVFANGGYRIEPYLVKEIRDEAGNVLARVDPPVAGETAERAIDERKARERELKAEKEYIAAIREGGVKVVETAGRSPEAYMPALKAAGIKVIHKCTAVRHALKAERIGCDAVSVDGFECGGHPGEDDVPNFILLPRAAEELKIPFIASGGMADGRSLVAAMAMGAEGMNMGTRFIATKEAPVHEKVKQAIVAASELDTRLVMRPLRNTERVLNNAGVERLLAKERALGDKITFEDIIAEVGGVYPRVMKDGDLDAGAWSCGMVAGLIHDIPTVKELIDRIVAEAQQIVRERLAGMV